MEVKNIKFGYQNKPLINDLSISFKKHKITSIIGPNGSGKSTLLMLISAFASKEFIFKAYQEAIDKKYRFFSFGDSMFII